MKRSEMVGKLRDVLMQFMPNEKHDNLRNLIADVLLTEAEREGMTPPWYEAVLATGKKFNKDTDFARDTTIYKGWEPEHEGDIK